MTILKIDVSPEKSSKENEKNIEIIKKNIGKKPVLSFQHLHGCGPCANFMPIWDNFIKNLPKDLDVMVVKLESAYSDSSVLPEPPHFPYVNALPKNTTEHENVPPHEEGLKEALDKITDKSSSSEKSSPSPEKSSSEKSSPESKEMSGGRRKKRKTKKKYNNKAKRKFTRKPRKYKSKTFKKKYSYKKVRFASKKKYRKTPRY